MYKDKKIAQGKILQLNGEILQKEFSRLFENNQSGYFISLEMINTWCDDFNIVQKLDTWWVYLDACDKYTDVKGYREYFIERYLRNEIYPLRESKDESDINKHFIMQKGDNGIIYPWFSITGFQMYCVVVNEPELYCVCDHFTQVQNEYFQNLKNCNENVKNEILKLIKSVDSKNN